VIDADRVWTSAAGAYGETVADHAVALALAGRRRLQECARADSWSRSLEGRPLFGCTVAVVGAGAIGRAVIRLLAPWDCRIVAVTRSGRDVEEADSSLPASALEEVWPQADVVVLAAPATDATRHLVGAPELARFRSDAVLVNVARGSLIDTDALVEALAAERLGCAALDVTDPEPLPDGHPLWDEQRALITPHVANTDDIRRRTLANFTRENIRRFAAGKELRGRIDPARGY